MLLIMEEYHLLFRVLITLVVAVVLSTSVRWLMKVFITRYAKKVAADATSFSFLKNSAGFIIYTAAFIYIVLHVPSLKSIGAALFAGAGILAAIIGFAAQKAFSNIVGGIFILMFRPFRVGDTIYIGALYKGIVEEITLRHIVIRNYEHRRIIIPNGIISEETIVNSSIGDEKIKKHIEFSIGYDSDIDQAIAIIREEAESHSLTLDKRTDEDKKRGVNKVAIRVISLGEYFILLRAYVWAANTDDAFAIQCDMNYSVKKRFDAVGVEIPFPYRNVIVKKEHGCIVETKS
ncbi:MAG: mechanosensitive ion channel family protein [Marinilabiliaceae bacterium]|nr:mechanosensitive ion channel family protein [Marinilabiliaceae bacterium]